ncbi:GNAT family N-acetyltransferase [Methylocystis sp. JAN1]|uniref:GNAT family N-acetyltransferase n=1 Tax=Methylocystis sp. JAN1 TaxID=3397211 RepID=UPI003FA1F22D
MCRQPVWRPLAQSDLGALCRVAAAVHPGLPERWEIFEEKLRLFPAGCFVLETNGALAGYAISHPWRLYEIPPLDAFLEKLPDPPDCLYLHDVGVTPAARGSGAAARLIERLENIARADGSDAIALTAVYGSDALWRGLGFEAVSDGGLANKLESYGPGARYMIKRG